MGRGMTRGVAWALVTTSVVGAAHAVRRGRPARFAGIRYPGTPAVHAATIGTPISAPPAMLVALVVAARRGRGDVVRWLGAGFLVGVLGEVDTWTVLRRPASDPVAAACVAGYLVLPGLLLAGAGRD